MAKSKKDIKYTYYFRGMPFAKFIAKDGMKLSGKLISPFDILIVGLANELLLEEDRSKGVGLQAPFSFETIGDVKRFLFDTDTYTVK